MQRHWGIDHGLDALSHSWVLNWTTPFFSIGFTTSPSQTGHLLGIWITDNAAKRQDQADGQTHKKFSGLLCQAAFIWFKFYFYVYFKGDGLD